MLDSNRDLEVLREILPDIAGELEGIQAELREVQGLEGAADDWRTHLESPTRNLDDYLQVATQFGRYGDRQQEIALLGRIGMQLRRDGRLDEAIAVYQRALAASREIGDRAQEGTVLLNLGVALRYAGQTDAAIDSYLAAAEILLEVGDLQAQARARYNAGLAMLRQARYAEAVTPLKAAVALYHQEKCMRDEASALNDLSIGLAWSGDIQSAVAPLQQSIAIYHDDNDAHLEAAGWALLGTYLDKLDRLDDAVSAWKTAEALFPPSAEKEIAEVREWLVEHNGMIDDH